MKLSFQALDDRGTTFEAHLGTPGEDTLLSAFEHWCLTSMPPEGEQWSRLQYEVPRSGRGRARAPAGPCQRVVVVFGDDGLARRFRSVWSHA